MPGTDPGGDLDDRALAGHINDDFGVRGAMRDADRADHRVHLPVHSRFRRRGQADRNADIATSAKSEWTRRRGRRFATRQEEVP